jgi:PA14 domain/Dolichyl-phosphate-mannose-protein mannosyltransferase
VTRAVQIAACILVGIAAFAAGRFALPETGLRGHYFTNLTRSGPPIVTAIDRAVSSEALTTGTAAAWTTYSVEWSGAIVIDRAGDYVFATVSDDGSEMDVAGQTVVRNGGLHGPQEAVGHINLSAGVHPIRVRYEQAGGGLHLELKYGLGEDTLNVIPASSLLPEPMSYFAYRARNAIPVVGALLAMLLFIGSQRLPVRPGIERPATLGILDRPAVALAVIVGVAAAFRIVMMFGSNGILWADSDVFMETVGAIRNGRWFEHDPFRTLLYPYFLAPFLLWSSEKPMDQVIVGVQHVLGLVTVVALFFAARAAFSVRIATVGALLFAVHTTQLFYENSILTEALFNCLLALSLLVIIGFVRTPSFARAMAVAAACVVLTLTRPVAQGFIAVPIVVALVVAASWRRRIAYAGAMAVMYVVALQPWMALNQRMFGFHGVALGQGLGLFIRTSQIERYEPSMYAAHPEVEELMTFARTTQSAAGHVVDGLRRRGYSSARTDDLLYRAALTAIAQRPVEFAVNSVRQWWRQLGSLDDEDICSGAQGPYICSDRTIGYAREPFLNRPLNAEHQPARPLVVWYFRHCRIPMHLVTAAAAFGVIAGLAAPASVVVLRLFLAMSAIYFTLLPAVTQSLQDRFRLPVDGLLFTFAAFGIAALVQIVLRRQPSN